MTKSIKAYLTLVFLLLGYLNQAQTVNNFATEPEQFTKDLQDFMRAVKRDDCTEIANEFAKNYKAGKFSSEQKDAIIKTANIMLAQKMHAAPQFSDYLTALNSFTNSGLSTDLFTKWEEILNSVIQSQKRGSTKDYTAFIEFSKGLFSTGNVVYQSNSKTWVSNNKDYELVYSEQKPKLVFKALDFSGITSGDTIIIHNTKGTYYPVEQKWEGQGGTVDWTKAGFNASEVYAEIGRYKIDMTKPDLKIDSVTFYHKQLFKEPLKGTFIDKLTAQKNINSFPLFVSYRKDLKVDDLGPNVKYEGGFALAGNQILGAGDSTGKVSVSFYSDQGKKVLQAWARNILIKKKVELAATDAEISLFLGDDSIYHPGLTLKYKMEKKELTLLTGNSGISASAFYDSYHRQEIRAEEIVWNLNDPEIRIKMIGQAGKDPVTFTSANFFKKGELDMYQGATDYNPIVVIKQYADQNKTREMDAGYLAKAMNPNYSESTIKRLLYKLVEDGFIYYNADKSLVTAKDKVFNYVLASVDKIDYDNIRINSISTQTNGRLNLETNNIALQGVKQVTLSDSQSVRIFPGKNDSILMKKNQDIDFSNIVIAGNIDFIGSGFHFDYDSFKVDLTNLASATINVPNGKKDKDGDAVFVPLKSKIEGLTGVLEIDKPDNKSGRKKYPQYPIFTNTKVSYVYYDKREIVDSAYVRDKFYFELDPFRMDSLRSFDAYKSDLSGRLVSADIFPTFEEHLKIQPDLSLGFNRVTPDEGYDIYKGKGHYNDSINLSNAGLQGKGRVKYLFTFFHSDSILFTPDSLNAVSDSFHMTKSTHEGHTYPLVDSKDNDIHWLPYGDSMYISMRTKPFMMYEEGSTLKGDLLLTAKGLEGNGTFEFKEASLESDLFHFQSESLDADTMSMQIKSIDKKSVTFKTPNVKGKVDFAKRIGEFKANEKDIPTNFSNNYYKTSIDQFLWDIDANILDFKAPEGSEGVYFTSTKPGQDSLKFLGKRGIFNMSTSIIEVSGIPEIRVADASIIPDSGKATIEPGGLLDSFTNAVVIADTANKAYKLYNAKLHILNRKDFKGDALYDYTYGNTKETIHFLNVAVKHSGERKKQTHTTTASTNLDILDTFKINNGIKYKGDLHLDAKKKFLEFDGFAKLDLPLGENDSTDWFKFKDDIDPANPLIHFENTVSDNKDSIFNGFAFARLDSLGFYASVMRKKKNPDDLKVFEATGVVKYDDAKKLYSLGDEDKITEGGAYGNVLNYDVNGKKITGEGGFDLGLDFKPIDLVTSGTILNDLDSATFVFNSFLGMRLPVDAKIMTQFATDINTFSFDKPAADYTNHQFEIALANTLDEKKAASVIEDVKKNGQFNKPKDLSKMNLIISKAELLYDPNYQIYRSRGPITVSFIGETGVHKQLTGYVEFGIRKGNDFFNIYFESKADDWYFLSYKNKTLQMISSKEDFNKMIAAIPPDKRKIKLGGGAFYFYTVGTRQNEQVFLQQMHQIESGVKIELDVQPNDDQVMQSELDSLKKELLKEENKDSLGTGIDKDSLPKEPVGRHGKRYKAPKPADINPDFKQQTLPADDDKQEDVKSPPANNGVLKEIEEFNNQSKKKKGRRGKPINDDVPNDTPIVKPKDVPTQPTDGPEGKAPAPKQDSVAIPSVNPAVQDSLKQMQEFEKGKNRRRRQKDESNGDGNNTNP